MATVVQSKVGGSGTGTTSAVGFDSATTLGSLLRCVVRAHISGSSAPDITLNLPITSGFTWVLVGLSSWDSSTTTGVYPHQTTTYSNGVIAIYEIAGAAVMATTLKTTASATNGGTSPTISFT